MAEFKLGRIRFIWKGTWTTGTEYVRDDIVQYGGKTFICILAHTASSDLETDLNNIQPKWEQFGDGITWRADWTISTYYKVNDIVKNGGYLYVCNTGHTSAATSELGLEADTEKWDLFAEGISYQGIWSVGTKYRVNDIAKYGATTYICINAHTSAALIADGLEANIADWNELAQGFEWKTDWAISTRYKKNDVVKYGGQLYICNTGHTSAATLADGLELDQVNWDYLNKGFEYKNDWTNAVRYKVNDVVKNGGGLWICITEHTSSALFSTDEVNWNIFLPGLQFEDSWNSATVYQPGDFVTYGGFSYVALTNHSNSVPSTNPTDWSLYITGFNLAGDWDNVTNYKVGDVVRAGAWTYLAILDNVGYQPPNLTYWKKLNEGFNWRSDWADVTDYVLGDSVRYLDNSYVCILNHTSSAADRPDLDTNGTYWNSLVTGTEENALTTDGDILYYSGAGPARLPIGSIGQILKVDATGTAPVWEYYGLVDNVYYVAPNGTDLPAPDYGITLDRPWQTVAYACAQILNATINPQAKFLLDENLDFVAKETVGWVNDQIANAAPGSQWENFVYDTAKCERDVRQAVRHAAYDLSHGGNVETRKAAESYFTDAGASYIAGQETQTVDALNYALTLVTTSVLPNVPVGTTYSAEPQVIDPAYTSETGTDTLFSNLWALITTSITNGDLTSLPAEQVINNTVFIKTGEYAEVLPISVPSHTALVGDELRSTRIIPDITYETSDMFYVRNGCGIRNMTLAGLNGTLGTENAYGTKRPTAGAYISLDPGEGPDDRLVWVHNKSTYVQNVTTFGNGCVGLKVDGDIHNGGNDSVVANDFTQVLSNGIGAWVTNLGRVELVSVFSYYGHIGYLAENGGKIRATNGNSSYGDFGCVSEGVDVTETPITATVNNRYSEALVDRVLTDANEILQIEYVNAGINYVDTTTAIKTFTLNDTPDANRIQGLYAGVTGTTSGAGTDQEFDITVGENGVITVTIVRGGTGHAIADVITFTSADIGGSGGGFTITIDTIGRSTEYEFIGEGFGIDIVPVIVNGGVTQVKMLNTNEDFGGEDYVTVNNNAQVGTSTQITISNTDTAATGAYVGMAIYIEAGLGVGQYGYIGSFDAGSKVATVFKMSDDTAGWDHVVPGTAIEALLDQTTNYRIEPRVTFSAPGAGTTAVGRAKVQSGSLYQINIINPGSGYTVAPTITITDPNNTVDAPMQVIIGDGVLSQPTYNNRGTGYETASVSITGDGYADISQNGSNIFVEGLTDVPQNGSNITFSTPALSGIVFKLVRSFELTGVPGNYKARLQISPDIEVDNEPNHGDTLTIRIRYSQVRLTGHDFLDIGTGDFNNTNYPGIPLTDPDPTKETKESAGGRVFYTSTDQDGNFRVGALFTVEQATGVATIDADNFSLSGLQELQLGSIGLGGSGAVIKEFSTDGTFAADSDNIVPTQRAIRTFLNSQIGGGAATLNVNTLIAGQVSISENQITTTSGIPINVKTTMNFEKGVIGIPLALQYFTM